jgi:diacylglycerol kinase family enzyme
MTRHRVAASVALGLGALASAAAIYFAITSFPLGVVLGALLIASGVAAWYGLIRRGTGRFAGLGCAGVALCAAIVTAIVGDAIVDGVVIGAAALGCVSAAQAAFAVRVPVPRAPDPARPVLFFNPKSGGGKAEKLDLAREARARGIEPIELAPGTELERLVHDAVDRGADAVAMAGGDGSQAIVAAIAADHDLPYACIPAGTRNHFALDLGIDRDDVVGALDAFVGGGERRVDLAEVNGRVFVNNVALGLYAEAVQRQGYREAKLKTLVDTLPDVLGPAGAGLELRWTGPGGHRHSSGAAILVSNNRYRLGHAIGSGTRPRVDDGLLGVTVASSPLGRGHHPRLLQRPWREWSTPAFEVEADGPIAAGIDGEAVTLDPPLCFRIKPGVLRVRIARAHPGASPSAAMPADLPGIVGSLVRMALAHSKPEAARPRERP